MDFLILTVHKGLIYRSSSFKKMPSDMVWYISQPFYQREPGCKSLPSLIHLSNNLSNICANLIGSNVVSNVWAFYVGRRFDGICTNSVIFTMLHCYIYKKHICTKYWHIIWKVDIQGKAVDPLSYICRRRRRKRKRRGFIFFFIFDKHVIVD